MLRNYILNQPEKMKIHETKRPQIFMIPARLLTDLIESHAILRPVVEGVKGSANPLIWAKVDHNSIIK